MKDYQCSVYGCEKNSSRLKMCDMHYRRLKRHGNPDIVLQAKGLSLKQRFYNSVIVKDGCWDWSKKINSNGYTALFFDGKWMTGNRASWILHISSILPGMHVLHKCDNRKCTNPDHLFLGSNSENVADKVSKGRQYRKYASMCSINGCENSSRKLGLCVSHYNKQYHENVKKHD